MKQLVVVIQNTQNAIRLYVCDVYVVYSIFNHYYHKLSLDLRNLCLKDNDDAHMAVFADIGYCICFFN